MKEKEDHIISEYINSITKPIFDKVLQETQLDPTREGRVGSEKPIQWLWQPHNYRLYFDFSKENFIPPKPENPTLQKLKVGLVGFKYESKNHNSEHHFNNFYGCRVIIRKNLAEVINKHHHKQWRLMTANNIDQIGERIDEVTKKMDNQCREALEKIISLFGGKSEFKVLKKRFKGEHGVHGIDFLDSIPEDMIIHDTIFKKEYKRKVEFNNPIHVKNTVTNYAMSSIAPEIANELAVIKEAVIGTLKVNADTSKVLNHFAETYTSHASIYDNLAVNIKTHNRVLKGIEKAFRKFNGLLTQKTLKEWT